MPKFTRNRKRIAEADRIVDTLRAINQGRIQEAVDAGRPVDPLALKIWLRLRDGSLVHGRYGFVERTLIPDWESRRPTARGWIHMIAAGGDNFVVDLLDVREVLIEAPDDYSPSRHTFCGWG